MVEMKITHPKSRIDDYAMHILSERNQEADRLANWVQKDKEQLLWTEATVWKNGKRCVASWMGAARSTEEAAVESLSKAVAGRSK